MEPPVINLVTAYRNWWQAVSSSLDNPGAALGDLIGAIVGFAAALKGADDPDAAANTANGITNAVEWVMGHLIGSHIDDLDSAISGLQAVANAGETAWYVVAYWNGQVRTETSQVIGSSVFYVGAGIEPPDAVLERVGSDMMEACADSVPSDFGNSPGVLKSQDSTYTDPCM